MDLLATTEAAQKLGTLQALSDAILRAEMAGEIVTRPSGGTHRKYTPEQARDLNQLKRQRQELRATMKPRLVA